MRTLASLLLALFCTLALSGSIFAQKGQTEFKKSYRSDMEAFLDEAQKSYPFFDVKGLRKEWKPTRKRLEKAAKKCKTDAEFIGLVGEGIAFLRDAHMYITECAVDLPKREPTFYTGASFMPATEGRVVVMYPPEGQGASMKTGLVVLEIDGQDPRKLLEERGQAMWEKGGGFSSPQRALVFEYRTALSGERGEKHEVVCLVGKKKKKFKLSCRIEISGWPHTYNLPADLTRVGRSFHYTLLPNGIGYMYLRRVDSSIAEGMALALDKHADAKAWVIDLRGNSGGGYGDDLLNQVKAVGKPIAVICDAGCISAGETLIRDFVRYAGARVFGSKTAGSSSSKREWEFPSGIAKIKFSTRSRSGIDGISIEYNGITPHEIVEVVPEEVLAGQNSEILRAEEYLLKELR
jgi:peptidase S41-like protein